MANDFKNFLFKAGQGNEQAQKSIKNIIPNTRKGIRAGLTFAGQKLRTTARRGIAAPPKSGRRYKRRIAGTNYSWQASAPGEFPANVTGALKNSINYQMKGDLEMKFGLQKTGSATMGGTPPEVYGEILELGGTKIRKRPFLKASVELNEGNVRQFLVEQTKQRTGK